MVSRYLISPERQFCFVVGLMFSWRGRGHHPIRLHLTVNWPCCQMRRRAGLTILMISCQTTMREERENKWIFCTLITQRTELSSSRYPVSPGHNIHSWSQYSPLVIAVGTLCTGAGPVWWMGDWSLLVACLHLVIRHQKYTDSTVINIWSFWLISF